MSDPKPGTKIRDILSYFFVEYPYAGGRLAMISLLEIAL